jgi:hypothetical protein
MPGIDAGAVPAWFCACSATLCVDLSEAGQLLLPRTYLQLVGQKLLGRASATPPVSNCKQL